MPQSAELRWFCVGNLPREHADWFFARDALTVREEPREDVYLRLPDCDNLGIKLREGNLEVKRLIARGEKEELLSDVVGRIEKWAKWSFPLAEKSSPQALAAEDEAAWLRVRKTRMLKKYEVAGNGIRAVNPGSRVAEGCNLELTEITIRGELWWSLGFEAFGSLDRVEQNLRLALRTILADARFPAMTPVNSCSYPEWLMHQS